MNEDRYDGPEAGVRAKAMLARLGRRRRTMRYINRVRNMRRTIGVLATMKAAMLVCWAALD